MTKSNSYTNFRYRILYGIAYLHSLLPFALLYIISDILFFLVYHVARYRRKLVLQNIRNSFPEKSESEIASISKQFYHHLCDYFVETIKTLSISDEEVMRRMKFENPELINRLTAEGQSCILSLGHFANWEWVPSIGLYLSENVSQGLMYKKLHSETFDRLFLKIRSRFKPIPIEMNSVYRKMINAQKKGETLVVGFLTDQRPPQHMPGYWTTFLNQDTKLQIGMERIATKLGCSIVYLDIQKTKRGYYEGKFFLITPDASLEEKNDIMERYAQKLEETINRQPAYYLWSHNRWKYKKESDEAVRT
ncbi:MAG: lysophospholipid acyltransferase family protein [Fermentimonas sp.]|jgi:KDO2-lipid IV(A) lauroyltransferase